MSANDSFGIVVSIGAVFLAVGSIWFQSRNCRNRLQAWAKDNGFVLLEARYIWRFQGPDAWSRSQYQTLYRVRVKDRQGQISLGWVTLGTYWGFSTYLNPEVSQVVWT